MTPPTYPLDGQALFFDLAGTLTRRDTPVPACTLEVLERASRRARKLVVVTGQPSDDPILVPLLDHLAAEKRPFVAYVTRGGLRLVQGRGSMQPDPAYLRRTGLPDPLRASILETGAVVLEELGVATCIPPRSVDRVAIRFNIRGASERPRFADELRRRLVGSGLQVVIEGRTSIFVMRAGVGKRRAVSHELTLDPGPATYFGDELHPGGNDHEILGLPGPRVLSVGEVPGLPSVGSQPEHLVEFLEHSLRAS